LLCDITKHWDFCFWVTNKQRKGKAENKHF
jgi:hypothetical protein